MEETPLYDFLADHRFADYLRQPTPELAAFWEPWLAQHPEHAAEIARFKTLIAAIDQANPTPATAENAALWQQLHRRTLVQPGPVVALPRRRWAIAATVALLLAAGLGWWFGLRQPLVEVRTAYGETQRVTLPDGSLAVLNSNSRLSYRAHWPEGTAREVELQGEAFFAVEKRGPARQRDRFVVHTAQVDVEVLGTKFNVDSRRPATKVVLEEGRVKLADRAQTTSAELAPGQLAAYDPATRRFALQRVNTQRYAAWKDRKLVFDQTSLAEVATILEDTYGLKVVLADPALAQRRISGEIAATEKESLLKALGLVYDLRIVQQGTTLTISTQ
jgi:ferric-dicitrate binding protein FerR (iron transport regulator)